MRNPPTKRRKYGGDPELSRWEHQRWTKEERAYLERAAKFAGPRRQSSPLGIFADATRFFLRSTG